MELSETQKCLIGGLELLDLERDSIIMVCLMLRSESQIMEMLEWLCLNFENKLFPTQEQVMDKAQSIMQNNN